MVKLDGTFFLKDDFSFGICYCIFNNDISYIYKSNNRCVSYKFYHL